MITSRLTRRQKEVLDFIKRYKKKHEYSPSLEEVKTFLGLSSVSTAHHHVKTLEEAGYLKKEENQARSIDLCSTEEMIQIPLIGTIAAGQPITAVQEKEMIAVPISKLPRTSKEIYALRVRGDSMIEENINHGDIVLIKNQSIADKGDKVVALINGEEVTLKKFYKENGKIRLQPANQTLKPIFVEPENLLIQGIVIDVIRTAQPQIMKGLPTDTYNKATNKSELPINSVIRGDVVDELKKLPDRSVDLIILDPPYWKVVNEHWDYKWRTESDYAKWCFEWFTELARVIKLSGSLYLFGYMRNLVYLYKDILDLGFIFRQQIIIDKGLRALGGRATKGYKMFPNTTESLLFFIFDSKPHIRKMLKEQQKKVALNAKEINEALEVKSNGGGLWSLYTGDNILAQVPTKEMWDKLQNVLNFSYPHEDISHTFNIEMGITDVWQDIDFYKENRFHTTQKPVKLIERLIKASTNEGMVVLDPFLGSGSTALACLNLKRKFVGIEIEEKYVKIAKERIADTEKIQKLF